jgi:hypothetical protein
VRFYVCIRRCHNQPLFPRMQCHDMLRQYGVHLLKREQKFTSKIGQPRKLQVLHNDRKILRIFYLVWFVQHDEDLQNIIINRQRSTRVIITELYIYSLERERQSFGL